MLPFYEIQAKDLRLIRYTRQLTFPAHMHRNIEILYVFSGVQYLDIDETAYEIHEGEAAIIFSDIVHSYYKIGENTADAILIICNPRLFGGVFPNFENFQPVIPFISKEGIHEEAVYALRHIKKKDEFAVRLGWTYVIMSHLLRRIELKQRQRTPVQDMSKKIMEYLANNFTEPLTLDSLAAEFCVSKYYISHIFSDRIKMNFRNYLGLLRAEYAAKLIRTTDAALTTISSNAGFDSQRTFNRIFHAKYGMSPREFRTNIRKYIK
ncbi:helix-turn-helix transcriptional regulator [Paenibacillus radicis (ex Xue et al. 2023)]|uniref:AraC family transcriptional regulator n=1 Tax=Paenibacillus radicis (ex Xue et al. 2023) TaxID=2972489 RepID=A0ABT1YLD2_9BACL|nr:AraC family transcriptional regulator [Paenibacillus radicis (ex Xue et al. 2023)]MCR8632745.1 AraC family transcriptional regulator [Paenibacillus radicis (ex Xue et al. 2023)]